MTLTEFETLTVERMEFTEAIELKGLVKTQVETKDGSKYVFYLQKKMYDNLRHPERPTHVTINGELVEMNA